MNIVSHDSESNYSTKFFAGLGSCAIGLNLSARFCGVLSDGLDGAIAMEGLKLRGSRRCEPPAQMQNGRSFDLPLFGILVASQLKVTPTKSGSANKT